jgi:hypothetical protein
LRWVLRARAAAAGCQEEHRSEPPLRSHKSLAEIMLGLRS